MGNYAAICGRCGHAYGDHFRDRCVVVIDGRCYPSKDSTFFTQLDWTDNADLDESERRL